MDAPNTTVVRRQRDLQVLDRDSRLLKQRPLPPRPTSLTSGILLWEHAAETRNITHYRIYNTNGQRFAEVPVGQTKITGFDTDRAFLSSYDSRTDQESYQVYVSGSASAAIPGGVAINNDITVVY